LVERATTTATTVGYPVAKENCRSTPEAKSIHLLSQSSSKVKRKEEKRENQKRSSSSSSKFH
jgi:hypothetical protein